MRLVALLVVLLAVPAVLQAQEPPSATGRLTGVVTDARSAVPLDGALLQLAASGAQAVAGADGRFTFDGVPAGPQVVMASVVGYALLRRDVTITAGETLDVVLALTEGATTYAEVVSVGASPFTDREAGVPGQAVLGSRELLSLRGVIADDPFRAVQVLPAVATGDDLRAEFAVRGQGPRQIGLALDGVDSPLLFHTVRGVGDTGSLALINSDVLESATLLTGAYPQRYGQHLGARLDVTTRDGARDRLRARAMVSGSATTAVLEGPFGDGTRGTWLAAARQSYIDWLLRRVDAGIDGTFGFTDAQAKITLTPTDRQALRVSMVAGRSALRDQDATPSLNSLDDAHNRTLIANLDWRYALTPRTSLTQQAYVVHAAYRNTVPDGRTRQEGTDADVTWRGSVDWQPSPRAQVTAGGQAQALRASRLDRRFGATSTTTLFDERRAGTGGAGWLLARWAPHPRLQLSPGVRVERWAAVDVTTAAPWLSAEWQVASATRLLASGGSRQQGPTFDETFEAVPGTLAPERAQGVDAGVEQRVGERLRLRATAYWRHESHGLRYSNSENRLLPSGTLVRAGVGTWRNVLDGRARGVELVVEHRSVNGLSGWASYAWGRAQVTDTTTGETYWADYDQRHGVNAYGVYRWSARTSLSGRVRWGSNFPLQGYVAERAGDYVVTDRRNETRLPDYLRVDLRADRTFTYRRSRLTLFVEVLNATARRNLGPTDGGFNARTGVFTGLTERMFPLLPSAGVLVEF